MSTVSDLVTQLSTFVSPGGLLMLATLLGAAGLWLMVPRGGVSLRWLGVILALVSLVLFAVCLPPLGGALVGAAFWMLAGLTLAAAVATVSSCNPVHSAIWFALALLTTAGLMLLSGAQFLGIATVVVYAGAIVVTFLFVLMLARPQGESYYDQISWGQMSVVFSSLSAAAVVGVSVASIASISRGPERASESVGRIANPAGRNMAASGANETPQQSEVRVTVQSEQHVASLGAVLFTRHLVSVQVAGTLLLAALVGAVAIASHGQQRRTAGAEEAS